jgi:transposase
MRGMKTRKRAAPVFKPYVMNQIALMPPSYDEKIPSDHLVRVVNKAIENLNVDGLLNQYAGQGRSSYHPKMMLKILIYGYCKKIYTSRKIAAAVRENIHFMWIAGENTPDHRTINDFRGKRKQAVIVEVFQAVVEYLVEGKYVKLENYFVEGTKIEADGNKHKVVWAKRKNRYEKAVKEQVNELLKQIEAENEAEEAEYGERDLEEMGGRNEDVNGERLKKKIAELNERLRDKLQKRENTSTRQALKKLESNCLPRLEKYEEQTKELGDGTAIPRQIQMRPACG